MRPVATYRTERGRLALLQEQFTGGPNFALWRKTGSTDHSQPPYEYHGHAFAYVTRAYGPQAATTLRFFVPTGAPAQLYAGPLHNLVPRRAPIRTTWRRLPAGVPHA